MILILSTSKFESTTEEVIRWLSYYQTDWKRVNGHDLENEYCSCSQNDMRIKDNHLSSAQFPVIWYRRWYEKDSFDKALTEADQIKNKGGLRQYLQNEFEALSSSIFYRLRNSFWLTNPSRININKLVVLDLARETGLQTPTTFVLTNKHDLQQPLLQHGSLITKAMTNSPNLYSTDGEQEFTLYTEEVKLEDLNHLPDTFFPTLFQQRIDKAYEIRVFYLEGFCYSMAIFSQRNKKTQVDFRHYDDQTPNRTVPYTLPKDIEIKIQQLMSRIGLNTGSIDLMIEKGTKQHYFLEINPIGQFGMVSIPCNYYLEKKVATLLTHKQKTHEKQTIQFQENEHPIAS